MNKNLTFTFCTLLQFIIDCLSQSELEHVGAKAYYPPQDAPAFPFPLFPFTNQMNTGVAYNPGRVLGIGNLVFPLPGWGEFDINGHFYTGTVNFDTLFGYQARPVNLLNIKPETLALLGQEPSYREYRRNAPEISVGRVPYGYDPIRCKPPFCNPFVHHVGAGVEVERGDDVFFTGGIDFPLPVSPNGVGLRFPLSVTFESGTSPFAYTHGHGFNPVTPFDLGSLDSVRRSPVKTSQKTNSIDANFHLLE